MDHDERHRRLAIALAAQALLDRLNTLTTDAFQVRGEHKEREALRAALGRTEPCLCQRCTE